ncbi:MAG: VanW family protein [Sandaracinaceae bacterium]
MDQVRAFATRWLERARVGGAVLSFAAAGGLAAWGLAREEPALARAAGPVVPVSVADEDVAKGSDAEAEARRLATAWERENVTLEIPGEAPWLRTRSALGARVDVPRLAARIAQGIDRTSVMRQRFEGDALALPLLLEIDESVMFEHLADLKDRYDRRAADARVNPRTGETVAHTDGRMLDVHATLDRMHVALERGEASFTAVVHERPATRSVDDLEGLDLSHVAGSYETRYANTAQSRNRTYNLRVAASKIDGYVVMPGETFDFNDVVGERSEANGFRPAPVIAGGELVDGLGGGTCQVAGTLHAAVFFAGLERVERQPHSRPSTYVYMGLDAVVSYPQLNFRFRNDQPHPVAIGFTVEGGIARAEIRGAPSERMVSFVRRVDSVQEYNERDVPDPSLPAGVRVLRQRGVPGFTVTTWRIVRDLESRQAVRTHAEDVYPPTQQVWRVGSGGHPASDYVAPEGDTHNEYTADAYLEVTQGAGVRGTQTVRRAGRYGSYGWTERLGFPQPDPARFE